MQKTIKICVTGAANIDMELLVPFQGDLKRLERDDYERLRKNIIENGYSFTIHMWKHKNKNYIIDGHQRLACLKMMKDTEGYKIPKLPVSIVQAANYKSALNKVLAGISQYGTMTETTLTNFIKEHDLNFEDIAASFSFPTINFSNVMENLFNDKSKGIESANLLDMPDMRSSSDGVKQIVLLFDIDTHTKFISLSQELGDKYKTESITDTVMEAMLEASKSSKKR